MLERWAAETDALVGEISIDSSGTHSQQEAEGIISRTYVLKTVWVLNVLSPVGFVFPESHLTLVFAIPVLSFNSEGSTGRTMEMF